MSDKTTVLYKNSRVQENQNLELLDAHEVLKLEEEIEILREEVESFKQLLHQQNQKIQELTQELRHSNHELCIATSLQFLTPDEATKLAKEIFSN